MKGLILGVAAAVSLFIAGNAFAGERYNTVPAGDAQYAACIKQANKRYEGGKAASPIPGQTMAEAWCTCLWNETPDKFAGSLVQFSESAQGKKINKTCEKYSGWHD